MKEPTTSQSKPISYNRYKCRCNIYKYRRAKRMTQDKLAHLVGVRRETICRIENDKFVPSLELAIALSDALEESVNALFTLSIK